MKRATDSQRQSINYIVMKNGERVNRSWLVYSESVTVFFAFLVAFMENKNNHNPNPQQLSEEGFNDWKNLAMHLINCERSEEHRKTGDSWQQLSHRLACALSLQIRN